MAFTLLVSKRGRPTKNKKDESGNVRVSIGLQGVKGNITRTFTLVNAKVSTVTAKFQKDLTVKQGAKKIVKKTSKTAATVAA